MISFPASVCQNQLLGALPAFELEKLSAHLEPISVKQGEIVYQPGEPIRYIYFPEDCIISQITVFSDGSSVESGIIGREGMTGVSVALSSTRSARETYAQTSGASLRIKTEPFQDALQSEALSELVREYSSAFYEQVMQTGACGNHHPSPQRLARLLLMCHDRIHGDEFFLTHEAIAQMLGIYRPSVTAAAVELKEKGLIDYHRGRVEIINRARLEREACECYDVIKEIFRHYRELLELRQLNSRMADLNGEMAIHMQRRRELENITALHVKNLKDAVKRIKSLRGPYLMCDECEMIQDEHGHWIEAGEFIQKHLPSNFRNISCPSCAQSR